MQRSPAITGFDFDVGASIQKGLHHHWVSAIYGIMKRGKAVADFSLAVGASVQQGLYHRRVSVKLRRQMQGSQSVTVLRCYIGAATQLGLKLRQVRGTPEVLADPIFLCGVGWAWVGGGRRFRCRPRCCRWLGRCRGSGSWTWCRRGHRSWSRSGCRLRCRRGLRCGHGCRCCGRNWC